MSPVLNASNGYYGATRRGVLGDGIIQNLFKSFGYKTYGIFDNDYFFRGIGTTYDFTFPEVRGNVAYKLLAKSIFMGEFRFNVEFDMPSRDEFIEHKLSVFRRTANKPRFIYMHSSRPGHSKNSGACLPDETERFRKRLIAANEEMKKDIEMISQKDPDAIIIVAGDHGPYLTKDCNATEHYDISGISRLDIQDRFGTFLAVKWPTDGFLKYDNITVLQDIFPAIFAYLYKDDKLLKAKVAPTTLGVGVISHASVKNGIIYGGINDGEPLFTGQK